MSRYILSASLCLMALTGCQSMSGVGTSFVQADRYEYPSAAAVGSIDPAPDSAASQQAPGLRASSPAARGNAAIVHTGMPGGAAADGLDADSAELAQRVGGKTELYTQDFDMGMSSAETRGLVREFFGDLPYRKYQPRPALPVININEVRTAMAGSQAESSPRPDQPTVAGGDEVMPAPAPGLTATPAPTVLVQAPRRPATPAMPARPAAPTPETFAAPAVVPVTLAPLPPVTQAARPVSGTSQSAGARASSERQYAF